VRIFSLTTQVKEFTNGLGAELVGICHITSEDYLEKEEKIQFERAIVVGLKYSDTAFKLKNIRALQYDTNCIIQELGHIAFGLVRFLEKKGYYATAVSPYIPVEMNKETKGFLGDVSHKHLGARAGLGNIGFSKLLITPDFGPRVRLASILTNAPLEPDKEYKNNLCEDCDKKCAKENMKYGLPGLIGFLHELSSSNDPSKHLKESLREPALWKIWQATTSGIFYDCFECIKACPNKNT
jgi:epoxyqueuosine reductase